MYNVTLCRDNMSSIVFDINMLRRIWFKINRNKLHNLLNRYTYTYSNTADLEIRKEKEAYENK
jgi:hypothetical protein